jgi:hypothetical protein
LDGEVSLGDGFWQFGELQAGHVGWAVAWQIADDGLGVGAGVNNWFYWFHWNNALADAATGGINHGWDVVFCAGFFTGNG